VPGPGQPRTVADPLTSGEAVEDQHQGRGWHVDQRG